MSNDKSVKQAKSRLATKVENTDEGYWICICGNDPGYYGFFRCDFDGEPLDIDLDPETEYEGSLLWVCDKCGRVVDHKTLSVVGYRKDNRLTLKECRAIDEKAQ